MYITTLITKEQKKGFHKLLSFCKINKFKWKFEKIACKNVSQSFIKIKTALRAARKWGPSFEVSLRTIFKKLQGLYTPQSHY